MERKIAALKVQDRALKLLSKELSGRGFIQLMPVMLSTATDPLGPDPGSSVITIPTVNYLGQELVITQSMLLQKQVAVASGIDRLFIVSPNVRLEDSERRASGRHLFEFSQLDFEISYGTMDDVMTLIEDIVVSTMMYITETCSSELKAWGRKLRVPVKPFKKYTTHELEAEYGSDWEAISSKRAKEPFWVLCHKREFYERESPPGHYRNFDLIWPEGFGEALSGSEREWEYDRLRQKIDTDGLSDKYTSYLEYAKKGLIPSAGAGLGVERLTRFLVGAKHVGDVQLFRRVPGESVKI